MAVIAPGYQLWRQRITVPANADSVRVQVVVAIASGASLATFKVSATRPQPRNINNSITPREGAAEKIMSEGVGVVASGDAGDIALGAALNPTLYASGDGIAALGLGADQSRITINGLPAASATMARDMRRRVRGGVTNYDPAIGGFSGASISVELLRGGVIGWPQFRISQDGDMGAYGGGLVSSQTGRRTVLSYTNSGEAIPDRFAYNIGVSAARRDRQAEALGAGETSALRATGISKSTLDALSSMSAGLGAPFHTMSTIGASSELFNANGRLDWIKGPLGPIALTFGGSFSQSDFLPGAFQNGSRLLKSEGSSGSLQFSSQRTSQTGWLTEWRVGGSMKNNNLSPSVGGPAFNIRLDSDSSEGIVGGIGGAGVGERTTLRRTFESAWQAERVASLPVRGVHQIKLFAQTQIDNVRDREGPSSGAFQFASLESFSARQPSSFTRILDNSEQSASTANLAFGVGDLWRPRRFLSVQLGLRADIGGIVGKLRSDSALEKLGLAKAASGTRFTPLLSPRVGFVWTYEGQKADGAAIETSMLGSSAIPGSGQLRGGFGLFRSYWNIGEALQVVAPGSNSQQRLLTCGVGSVPQLEWYANQDAAPAECGYGSIQPVIQSSSFLSRDYSPPAAWRGNLTLTHAPIRKLKVELGAVASYGINQRVTIDRNLPATPAFSLPGESNRPSFRRIEDIDPATGFAISQIARPVGSEGAMFEHLNTGRNRAYQVSLSLFPKLPRDFSLRIGSAFTTAQQLNASSGGLEAGAEPLDKLYWMKTPGVPKWRSVVEFGRIGEKFALTGVARFDAGAGYTPVVSGDINGDGFANNDRAFVFADYLSNSSARIPGNARQCLEKQVNSIARTASCSLPLMWTADVTFSFMPSPPAVAKRGAGRISYNIRVNNIPGLLDRAFNGTPKGWGRLSTIDPVLARVEGFDPATRKFRYAQNMNFGKPNLGSANRWAPYSISIDAQVFLGSSVADQQAVRTLKRSNVAGSRLRQVDSVVAQLRKTFSDPYEDVLMESDSLLLNRVQIEAIVREQRVLNAKVDSVWRTAAVRFVPSSKPISNREAGELLQKTYTEVVKTMRAGLQPLKTILSDKQLARAPSDVKAILAGREPLFRLR